MEMDFPESPTLSWGMLSKILLCLSLAKIAAVHTSLSPGLLWTVWVGRAEVVADDGPENQTLGIMWEPSILLWNSG